MLSNKANLRNKLVTSAGLPLIIAISLMLNIVIQKQNQIATLQFTQVIVDFDIAFGKFIDAYNKEIELSMLLLINNDDSIKKNLKAQRKLVDNLSPQIKDYLLNKGVYVGRIERSYIKTFEQNLALMRKNVDDGSVSWQYIINFFLASNKDMLARLNTFSEQIINKDINKRHVNFLTLIKIKSINNVNRVVLTAAIYSAKHDKLDQDIRPLKRSIRLKNNQEKTYFDIFTSSLVEEYKVDTLKQLNHKAFKDSLIRQTALEERKTEQLSAQLKAYLGYNGLIHQFKNYLLRGDKKYLNSFIALHEKIVVISSNLREILQYDVKAIKYLDTFNAVMNEYKAKISLIKKYRESGLSVIEIDKVIAIDDTPASLALQYFQNSLWEYDPNQTLKLIIDKQLIINDIESNIATSMQNRLDEVLTEKRRDSYLTAAIALILSLLVIALLIIISRNISLSYQQRTSALKKAEEAAKLKSEFLANMSHEIRTPMNGILGMLGLLLNSNVTKEQHHQLNIAKSSADALLTLINDILDFSKVEAGKIELEYLDFNVRNLFGDFTESMALNAQEKNLEIILDLTGVEHSMVKSDPGRIRQILTNIVGNAIKFTDAGEIVLTAKLTPLPQTNLMQLQCSITDTGIGIPKEKQQFLFNAFSQVDASTTRKYGGSGLGLTITKKFCQLLGGDIHVESSGGEGSCFTFTLQVEKSEQSQLVLPKIDVSTLHILIVDDNATNREVLRGQLNLWGATVTEAENGQQALTICENTVENNSSKLFDIAILDMQMPEMNGAELAIKIRNNPLFDTIKLVMMTSMGEKGDAQYFADIGFSAYFPKPTTTVDIFNALSVVADNGEALKGAKPLVTHHYLNSVDAKQNIQQLPQLWPAETRILLVEDNRVNQVVAISILKQMGLTADVSANGIEAINALKTALDTKPYSIVIMDCQMPEMDGYEATKQIRLGAAEEMNKQIPIIAMTANAMQGDKEKCLAAGMSDYLSKPIEPETVHKMMMTWLKVDKNKEDSQVLETVNDQTETVPKMSMDQPNNNLVWNQNSLSKRVNGNQQFMSMMINAYIEDNTEKFNELNKAISEKDKEKIKFSLHSIKGSAGNIGGLNVQALAASMELTLKEEGIDAITQNMEEFTNESNLLIAELTRWLSDQE